MYLLPAIDILDGRAVRLAKGDYNRVTVYNEDPVEQAKRFEDAGATWVHVVDLNGARSGKQENLALIERIAESTSLKVENGGGVRDMAAVQRLYDAGVSRVVLGSALVVDKEFAEQAIGTFGDLLCAGIDARGGEVAIQGWREGAGVPAEELVAEVAAAGFKHLVYTDISRDGMQTGIDASAYERMSRVFGNPVIASGGVTNMDDLRNLAQVAQSIEGVITGRAVYEGTLGVAEAQSFCDAL
ncbi:phosphoribosylformimino-5-aminoimidazole carboxamide ribotide isomerase [Denitrobacterium detoxificans]|uniref:1-(5-phosphoribosyl)-5-[(5-phosphoribosylamino)methylideneamino] imidazole-4-carboxamide isomerase n=1 Tax=Denitrobacterium detoxificans TaxID=79604 RepID=A0A172RWV2_9ACTN|nr:1-(5-phosphoribosyl)-5-[(5-phosphoribosylamino)methylideneamino]imidazole-4-carboxamide isomerase [Denitrobacterium detoxificans]ANE22093.1 phosphoribosylformimino-5-aminoimidazole carboxamide ribotide isomerase [Denitrobacterium detoxificans]SEO89054.1 1-(5-phosphoribosyl)-5-[(5-phosphoribosylamino)methylideneamino] imidazole-4-carboxamide isomerase [Denitrobacterium detoxificans]